MRWRIIVADDHAYMLGKNVSIPQSDFDAAGHRAIVE